MSEIKEKVPIRRNIDGYSQKAPAKYSTKYYHFKILRCLLNVCTCDRNATDKKVVKLPRVATLPKDSQKKIEKSTNSKADTDAEIYGDLDASRTLLVHGLESDFIEEQMADDEVFR